MNQDKIGVIGGTGVYQLDALRIMEEIQVDTPFGSPSSIFTIGKMGGRDVIFLPRHGKNHQIMPSEVNYRANIYALKELGVTQVIGVSAVGSLQEKLAMGDLVVPEQYFDWTKGIRKSTFFGNGMIAHISTAEPSCSRLAGMISKAGASRGLTIQGGITYGCVEGPRLGTRAESNYLRKVVHCDVVGMSNIPEAFLAREAQMCYVTIAIVTDYDCWLDDPSRHASVAQVFETYGKSIDRVKVLLGELLPRIGSSTSCNCRDSLSQAMLTPEEAMTDEQRAVLKVLKK